MEITVTQRLSFFHAVKWSYIFNWSEKGWSALIGLFLAALLGPADFGAISIALMYIGFLQMFLDQGLTAALIQKQDLGTEHLSAVFWVNMATSLVAVVLSVLFGTWWAAVNHAPQVATLIPVLSLTIVIEAASIVHVALLKREMNFKLLAIRSNISVLIGGLIGAVLAIEGYGVWALVCQQLVRDSCALVLLWRLSPWRPGLKWSLSHLIELTHFSLSNFVAQLALFADGQAGPILLGVLFGPVAVGLYRFAERMVNTATSVVMSSIQAVSFPEFSRLQNHPVELRRSVLTCIRVSSALTLPTLAGLGAVSGPFMAMMGPRWQPATMILRILCAFAMVLTFAYFTGPLLQALSKPGTLAVLEWSRLVAGSLVLAATGLVVRRAGVEAQLIGIGLARFATAAFLVTPVFVYMLLRLSRIPFWELLSAIAPSVAAATSVVAAVEALEHSSWFMGSRPLVVLPIEVAVGAMTGLLVLFGLEVNFREPVVRRFARPFSQKLASSISSDL